jgi:hypothetical protein
MKSPAKGAIVRIAASHADKIRKAFNQAIDSDAIAQSFAETHPAGGQVTPAMARDWAKIHTNINKKPLVDALKRIYADGWVTGNLAGRYVVAHLVRNKAVTAPKVGVVDWETWTPGNQGAAALLSPKGGLQSLLGQASITIDGISNTKLDRIGTILSQALAQGATPSQVSIMIDQVVDDPQQALTIAQTEMSRATVQSELAQYRDSGVEMVEWLVADPCDDCQENEDQSPISIDEDWINGDAPVHPNCMCDIAPYFSDNIDTSGDSVDSTDDSADTELAVKPDLVKFVPSKLEVERALSRLKILPNPPQVPQDIDVEKVVESPWKVIPVITVDPSIWDNAELALVRFEDLTATDEYMRRKKVKEHIEAMGAGLTPYRNFALVVERNGEQIIIDGHHRLMSMWLLGMTEAPVWLAKEN